MPAKKTKILIVEDDPFLMNMYVTKFELENFDVSVAEDGDKGYKIAVKEMPDLIMLDIMLPKADGFEVLKKIKGAEKTKNIPVMLLTNLSQKEEIEKAIGLGAADYLIKAHYMPSEVVDKVKKALNIA